MPINTHAASVPPRHGAHQIFPFLSKFHMWLKYPTHPSTPSPSSSLSSHWPSHTFHPHRRFHTWKATSSIHHRQIARARRRYRQATRNLVHRGSHSCICREIQNQYFNLMKVFAVKGQWYILPSCFLLSERTDSEDGEDDGEELHFGDAVRSNWYWKGSDKVCLVEIFKTIL